MNNDAATSVVRSRLIFLWILGAAAGLAPLAAGDDLSGPLLPAQAPALPAAAPVLPAEAADDSQPAVFGIVVRLSEDVFRSPNRYVSRTTPVSQTIAGLHNRGTAHVTGEMSPDVRPRQNGIAMDMVFRGTSVSHTVGRQRGAVINTSTTTHVSVTTPVTFDLESGFVAGASRSHAAVAGMCHRVGAEVFGLRGLITRRVARKRVARLQPQIRCESAEATRRRIASEARQEVERELARLNAQLEPWRQFLLTQAWYRAEQKIEYASDERHLILTVRGDPLPRAAEPGAEETITFPPATLPPAVPGGLVDVFFYEDPADKIKVTLLLQVIEAFINEYTAELPIADRLSFDTTEGPDWVRLSVSQNNTAGPSAGPVQTKPMQTGPMQTTRAR